MRGNSDNGLFHHTSDSYVGPFTTALIEQYKLVVQSAENASVRRINSISHLLTLNLGLFALYGFQFANFSPSYWMVIVSCIGLVASFVWIQIIKSYRNLNALKFRVIHEIELHLPAAPFDYEWKLREQDGGNSYIPVTHTEKWIPIGFVLLHVAAAFIIFLSTRGLIEIG